MQEAINKVREEIEIRIRMNGERIDMLRFTNNTVVITDNEEVLENILKIMNLTIKNEYNIKINKAKTKILVCSSN